MAGRATEVVWMKWSPDSECERVFVIALAFYRLSYFFNQSKLLIRVTWVTVGRWSDMAKPIKGALRGHMSQQDVVASPRPDQLQWTRRGHMCSDPFYM